MKSGKQHTPTMTVTPARVRLFEASQRPRGRTGEWVETAWGRCKVIGRIGQRHADLLEAILHRSSRWRNTDDGAMELLVDPAEVRRTLSDSSHSGERIAIWLRELMGVIVEIETPKLKVVGHLVDHVIDSQKTHPNPLDKSRPIGATESRPNGASRKCRFSSFGRGCF